MTFVSAPRSAFLVACWLAPASSSLLSAPRAHTCGVARARGAAACADADAFLGAHVLMDYEGVVFDDASEGGAWCLAALGDAVAAHGICEVHRHLSVLGDAGTPPGFTSVVLLDESHVTAHSYSERGLLAIDCFTCGAHDPRLLAETIHRAIVARVPAARRRKHVVVPRFPVAAGPMVGAAAGEQLSFFSELA